MAKAPSGRPAQGFTTDRADAWIVTSAVLTGAIYGFRALVENNSAKPVTPFSKWAASYGTLYLLLAVMALGAPELAASLAFLVVSGNLLTNGVAIAADLTGIQGASSTTTTTEKTAQSASNTQATDNAAATLRQKTGNPGIYSPSAGVLKVAGS